jgi:hypothetical protein
VPAVLDSLHALPVAVGLVDLPGNRLARVGEGLVEREESEEIIGERSVIG